MIGSIGRVRRRPVPPWTLAVASMLSVQLGSALSIDVIGAVGSAGTAWLRLSFGAMVLLIIARPPLRSVRRQDIPLLVGLGMTTALQTVTFLAAIERIPLGTAVAIEFLGPLAVAAINSRRTQALVWPILALGGVALLTEPWHGAISLPGIGFAVLAAIGWAAYILLTQRVGDRFTGIGALSMTLPVAAIATAVVGIPQAAGHMSCGVVAAAAGLALLLPVLPFALELQALREMTPTAFGTLMALEPAFGVILGMIVLGQGLEPLQFVGIVLVVVAGAVAQRGGRRTPSLESSGHPSNSHFAATGPPMPDPIQLPDELRGIERS